MKYRVLLTIILLVTFVGCTTNDSESDLTVKTWIRTLDNPSWSKMVFINPAETVYGKIIVNNTGDVPITNIWINASIKSYGPYTLNESEGETIFYEVNPLVDFTNSINITGTDNEGNTYSDYDEIKIDVRTTALIETNKGDIRFILYEDKVPITVSNFKKLANDGFYEDLVFHRVIDDFVVQSGAFYADGTYKISPYGPIELELHPDLSHVDGAVGMSYKVNEPNSATSQFYICDGNQYELDGEYAVFGLVISGLDVVREISQIETAARFGRENWPNENVTISNITIYE
jgi:cyclophilin family peptidyl-prolyl cis-trans isomerase